MIVLLDSGPLGLLSQPRGTAQAIECRSWLDGLVSKKIPVCVPEIADYEVRRELIRARKLEGLLIARLNWLKESLEYLPLTTSIMLLAAAYWAEARNRGKQTAADSSLDADMILAAQAKAFPPEEAVVIATTNPGHLTMFTPALHWKEIL